MKEVASRQLHEAKPIGFTDTNSHALVCSDEDHGVHHAADGQEGRILDFPFIRTRISPVSLIQCKAD